MSFHGVNYCLIHVSISFIHHLLDNNRSCSYRVTNGKTFSYYSNPLSRTSWTLNSLVAQSLLWGYSKISAISGVVCRHVMRYMFLKVLNLCTWNENEYRMVNHWNHCIGISYRDYITIELTKQNKWACPNTSFSETFFHFS